MVKELRKKRHDANAIQLARTRRQCIGNPTKKIVLSDKYEVLGCVCRHKHSSFLTYWEYYSHYKQTGNYPDHKSLLDQTNKIVDIFNMFKTWENELRDYQESKAKKKK